jgi:glycosyltransferase involved in cell wall biosynthesis
MLISITMPVLNGEKTIKRAIKSILCQNYSNWELILVDGESSDQTIKIAQSFNDKRIKVFSIKPLGLYNAINFGIEVSKGDYIINLNCDDFFIGENFFDSYFSHLKGLPDMLYSNLVVHHINKGKVLPMKSGQFNLTKFYFGWFPPHPTYMIRRDLALSYHFNESYKISGDYDWLIRILNDGYRSIKYIRDAQVGFQIGGVSSLSHNQLLSFKEDIHALNINLNYFFIYLAVFKRLRKLPRKIWEMRN